MKLKTYALGGEGFVVAVAAADAPAPLGLPLPERACGCAGAMGVTDTAAVVRWAESDDAADGAAGGAKSAPKEGLSWGAGEGAIAMAILIVKKIVVFFLYLGGGYFFFFRSWVSLLFKM
jgi:hypothetical protein